MAKGLLKYKHLVLLGILMGVLSFSVCQASVMPQSMDGADCKAQTFCIACPVPVNSDSIALSNVLTQTEFFSENPSFIPNPHNDPFYHPPR